MHRRPLAYFLLRSSFFLVGLVLTLAASEGVSRRILRDFRARGVIGTEVASAVRRSQMFNDRVTSVYLGDSVAHQLLAPGTEPGPTVRFLAANQAISVAGQCYLLENALRAYPKLQDVYLLYIPGCFNNNLPRELSHDYFCGYFHSPEQVREVFAVKHDFGLSAAHVGRMLLPNLMMQNSMWWRTSEGDKRPSQPAGGAYLTQAPPDPEPLLAWLTRCFSSGPEPPLTPAGSYGTTLPPVSSYYLEKMRRDCRSHGVRLHILPCPLSTREVFLDPQHVYDAAPLRVEPRLLVDAVHFHKEFVPEWRARIIEAYKLPL